MNPAKLLDHLSLFENLITLPPDQLMKNLSGYVALFTSVGRFIIILMFVIHLTSKLATRPVEEFKKNILTDVFKLSIIMAIFGNSLAYTQVCNMGVSIFNYFTTHILQSEFVSFKGSFRVFLDTLAEQSKQGVDFFNIKAMTASALTLFLSLSISLLLITYYVFVSVGMFELLIVLAIGPVIAGFFFYLKTPFLNWLNAILASLAFPITTAVAVTIINHAGLFTLTEEHLREGSLVTCLIQILLGIAFMQLVIIFHAAIWGVQFINVPVKVITVAQLAFGMAHSAWLNITMIIATKKKGS